MDPLAVHHLPGLVLLEHALRVPLDHARPGGPHVDLFAREVVASEREHQRASLPWLLFLQGGPGFGAPRPTTRSGWLARALQEFRVLLLDQRGTGRSSPIDAASLAALGDAEHQAEHLAHFRADAIVDDCEALRAHLSPDRPWTVLGQSYGGFCAVRYLSAAPEGLAAALIAGGLPPLSGGPDAVYRRTYPHVRARNERYFARYPEDAARARAVVDALAARPARLPSGDVLTPRRFQTLGLQLGFSDGFEIVHYLLEDALSPGGIPTWGFLKGFESTLAHDTHPLFSLLHEACYTQGEASRWSAERLRAEHPEFEVQSHGPVLFTGEMIYPWMFEEIGTLRPLREVARRLAERTGWSSLYDPNRLANNRTPVAAVIYFDDMYVDRELSLATARGISGTRTWVTDELEHNGLRSDGERVLSRLLDLARGRA